MAIQPIPPRLELAGVLVDAIRTALLLADDDVLKNVLVTTDPREMPGAAPKGVVVIDPPSMTFETYTLFGATWTAEVVAGPFDDMLAAWDTADRIIEAIRTRSGLNLTSAQSGNYTPPGGTTYLAGYLLTITDEYQITED